MIFRKIRKNLKAISPIISVLLMIAIAVVASLVVYAWVMGYIGYQTGKTGDSVVIQSVVFSTPTGTPPTEKVSTVYLQNIGSTTITINPATCLYVNGLQDTATGPTTLAPGTTATLVDAASNTSLTSGQTVTIKVTTLGGTYSQVTQQAP